MPKRKHEGQLTVELALRDKRYLEWLQEREIILSPQDVVRRVLDVELRRLRRAYPEPAPPVGEDGPIAD